MLTVLDLHGFEDIETTDKVQVINDTIQDICTRDPWPFLESTDTISAPGEVNGTTGAVTLPSDFTSLLKIVNTNTSGYRINFIRMDEHFERRSDQLALTGIPYNYFFLGEGMRLWPIPETGDFTLVYIREHPEVTSGTLENAILIPKRHHKAIPLGAIYRLHAQEDDAENAQLFKAQYEEKISLMRQDLFIKQWDSPDSVLVMDWDLSSFGDLED